MRKLLLLSIMLSGCSSSWDSVPVPANGSKSRSQFIAHVEGCDIFKVEVKSETYYLYLSKCESTSSVQYNNGGKNPTSVPTITYQSN